MATLSAVPGSVCVAAPVYVATAATDVELDLADEDAEVVAATPSQPLCAADVSAGDTMIDESESVSTAAEADDDATEDASTAWTMTEAELAADTIDPAPV